MDPVLRKHGTEFMRLKTQNVVQAAVADLKLLKRKEEGEADQDRRYSFMSRHVRRARQDVVYLIALAYFEGPPKTDKDSTQTLYDDRQLLLDALINCLLDRRHLT